MSPARRPLILHVIPRDGIGGVEVAAHSMLARADLPCDFRLLVVSGDLVTPSDRAIALSRRHAAGPGAARAVARAVAELRPDVVIFSLWRTMLAALLTRLLSRRTRIVLFLHAAEPAHLVDRLLSRIGMLIADAVWADSRVTLLGRTVPRRLPARVVSFVVERRAPPIVDREPGLRLVTWCRLTPQKGIDRALRLVALLVGRGREVHYDIWGPDGGEQPALERLADELGIRDFVSFRGAAPRTELPKIAAANSFFLQLSRFEGMAMAVVEAMQLGLVPVATGVGQMAAYVRDGETGIRVEADQLGAAAERIISVLERPDRYKRMRRAAITEWRDHPLYAEDVCRAAADLLSPP